jgi:hypothetical protein
MMLVVFLIAMLLWFLTPVASINSATCARIKPGMTLEQATEIIGAPQDSYDGVAIYAPSHFPDHKGGGGPSWVGWRGELVLELDELDRVESAKLYSIEIHEWSLADLLSERFTRVRYSKLTTLGRILLFVVQTALGTSVLGMIFARKRAKNGIALHGLIGLLLGFILAIANFSHGFFVDLFVTIFALGPIVGAVVGIAVGVIGEYVAGRSTNPTEL